MAYDVTTSNNVRPAGVALQTGKQGEVIDLRDLVGKVNASFTVNREAAFNNFVGSIESLMLTVVLITIMMVLSIPLQDKVAML